MLTLLQIPWSPFCISLRRILVRHRIAHRVRDLPPYGDRAAVVRATKGRGATVPCLLDGRRAVVDTSDFGQEVARYVDAKFRLGLFPRDREGLQLLLARYLENDLEAVGFKVNDSHVIPSLPLVDRVNAVRWKERKFGRGCVQQWTRDRAKLAAQMAELLRPLENLLASSPFLLGPKPLFADYDLYGVLGNYLYSGKTRLPPLKHLRRWHAAM
jgi:glutathione S-transferase